MESKPALGNVIDMRTRSGSLPHPELFAEIRTLAFRRFPTILAEVLDQADDALFDFVQRSSSSVEQQEYFDAMRELRRQRAAVELRYREHFLEAFTAIERLRPASAQIKQEDDGEGLSLIEPEELEDQLACDQMAKSIERRHHEAQLQLDSRLAILVGLPPISTDCNPIGPAHLCSAFRYALGAVEMRIQARLVLYKLFEREALGMHGQLIHEANLRLHQAGIEPEVVPVAPVARERQTEAIPRSTKPDAAAAGSRAQPRRAGVSSGSMENMQEPVDDLFAAVQEIFSSYLSTQRGHAAAAGATQRPSLGARSALTALSMMQREVPASVMRAVDDPKASLCSLLKQELLGKAMSMGMAESNTQLIEQDEQALFLVGMLFDVLLGQRSYERPVREQFVKLSVPYAKAAMLDQRLFAQKSHPARRLLNALSEACDGNHGESASDRELLSRVTGVVDRLVAEFNEDTTIFSELEQEFRSFLEQYQKRIELAERRATEAQRGRERLEEARISAAMELALLMGAREAPPALDAFLGRYWTHHLAVMSLREGPSSQRYMEARAAGEMLWRTFLDCENGSEPPAEMHERLMPVLASSGVTGEAAADVLEAIDFVLQALRLGRMDVARSHGLPAYEGSAVSLPKSAVEQAAAAVAAAAQTGPVESEAGVPASFADSAEPMLEVVGGTGSLDFDAKDVERIRALEIGAWVEFMEADGSTNPAKLSWISPISSRLLFVNRRGLRLCATSAEELAALMKQGRLVLREADSAFERAMTQVLGKMREAVPGGRAG
jgi:hypothetical protein